MSEPEHEHETLNEAVAEFAAARPWLSDPDAAREVCTEVSEQFVELLHQATDVRASVISGLLWGELPQFPGVPLVMAGHSAALVEASADSEPRVYDWTARQFDPDAPVPLVQPLSEWRRTWAWAGA